MILCATLIGNVRVEEGTLLLANRCKCSGARIVTCSLNSEATRYEDTSCWGILLEGAVLIWFALEAHRRLGSCLLLEHGRKDAILPFDLARYLPERLSILVNLQSALCLLNKCLFASYWISLIWNRKSVAFLAEIVPSVFLNFGLA